MSQPRAEYDRRLDAWRARIIALDAAHLRVSNLRLVTAAAAAVACWLAFGRNAISSLWIPGIAAAFVALMVIHARILERRERAQRAERWYVRGLDRLNGTWPGKGRHGGRFLDDHPYARDLDLFGRGSVFELMNTASTEAGEETLADWLRAPASIPEIGARQTAAAELREKIDFREDLAVLAAESEVSRTGSLASWAAAAPAGLTRTAQAALAASGVTMAAVAWLVLNERLAARWLIIWLLAESLVALVWRRPVHLVLSRIATPDRDLALVGGLLSRIETERVSAPRLAELEAVFVTDGVPPSRRIAQLRRLVSWLDSTRNQMFAPIALALLLPQQLAAAIDRWHAAYGPHVVLWLKAIGELEALSAIGTYAFEHPNDPFPTLADGGPLFGARALGHPLMVDERSVRNDVALGGGAAGIIVISGSNMSGKSTLLRSVGVNVVLAQAGAPVRATELTLSPLAIGATLKVEDSLQAGHSRFYAEILRIRDIVQAAREAGSRRATLFLLDEILHGTNSHDRRIGAEAIVRALARLGAIGLVTTHDLALTALPERLGDVAVNMHFEDRLEDGRMTFDYRMRPGVVEHSNALALMRAVGLDV
jgi:MutS domain V